MGRLMIVMIKITTCCFYIGWETLLKTSEQESGVGRTVFVQKRPPLRMEEDTHVR
jgi:hypothetical protein